MKRRKKGTGTIYEYAPGQFILRVVINRQRMSFTGSSEREVERKRKEFQKKVDAGKTDFRKLTYHGFSWQIIIPIRDTIELPFSRVA